MIRRSHKRKDVEETGADATLCKQSETRHIDESFPLDQSAHKPNVVEKYKDVSMKDKTQNQCFIMNSSISVALLVRMKLLTEVFMGQTHLLVSFFYISLSIINEFIDVCIGVLVCTYLRSAARCCGVQFY